MSGFSTREGSSTGGTSSERCGYGGQATSGRRGGGRLVSLAIGVVLVTLTLLSVAFYARVFKPYPYMAVTPPYRGYSSDPMQRAMQADKVRTRLDTILSYGSRLLGQPGMYRTAEHIRTAFERAGLETYEHELQTATERTAWREVYEVRDGAPGRYGELLRDVEVYPFMPNHLQPVVTPDTGLVGRLVVLDSKTLRTRERFDDCIGLLDCREGGVDPSYEFAWARYAALGVKAIVVAHPAGLDYVPWQRVAGRFQGMVLDVPVNYVRVAANSRIFDYVGCTIRLRVRQDFVNVPNVNFYGVLRAPSPASEAVIVVMGYDAKGLLPDRALCPMQAINTAAGLQLLEGMTAYRGSIQRDVIFVAFGSTRMSEEGLNNLMRVLGWNAKTAESNRLLSALGISPPAEKVGRRMRPLVEWHSGNNDTLRTVERLRRLFDDPLFLSDPAVTAAALDGMDKGTRRFFNDQVSYVLNTIVVELSEPKLLAKIALERELSSGSAGELFQRYLRAKRDYDVASAAAGYDVVSLLRLRAAFVHDREVRGRCVARLDELADYHRHVARRLEQEMKLVELFDRYSRIAAFELRLTPALVPGESKEELTFDIIDRRNEPAVPSIQNTLTMAVQTLGISPRELEIVPPGEEQSNRLGQVVDLWTRSSTGMWQSFGYPAFAYTNLGRLESYRLMGAPSDVPAMRDIGSVRHSLRVVGESILSLAHGNGVFHPFLIAEHLDLSWGGQVLVSNVGFSIVPNYPLKGAIISTKPFEEKHMHSMPGYHQHLYVITNPYGRYYLPHNISDFESWWYSGVRGGFTPSVAGYGPDGLIAYMKDEGEDGQRLFKSINIPLRSKIAANTSIVMFRAVPVSLLDLTNPQNMKDYTGVRFIDRNGLTPFRKICTFYDNGIQTAFLEPDKRFYVELQSGAPENELVKMTRAFMLGIDDPNSFVSQQEIDGPGYLAADNPFLLNVPHEVGRSMGWVNEQRLRLQNRFSMADEQTNAYHTKALERLAESRRPGLSLHDATLLAREAVTYATLTHPVLRQSIFEAVVGILWYLGLLVPFVFFFEKLLFCHTDVRKQIAAQAVIFLGVFILLRILHPAFHMVRSSLMILLGFIIVLISGGITLIFSSKFQENLEELRRRQGKVAGAEVNRMGVMMAAFMLGLNNMNRRKVRTGLTCATLALLTFVMICFTSVQNRVVEENLAVGKAAYQGILVKRERMLPLSEAEVISLRSRFGNRYAVCQRRIFLGREDWQTRKRRNPELNAVYRTPDGVTRRYELESAIQMNWNDPLRQRLEFLTPVAWFTPAQDRESDEICPVMIPDKMADNLGIAPADVARGQVVVTIAGRQFAVQGIFSSESLRRLRDLDNRDILPFDVKRMRQLVMQEVHSKSFVTAEEDDPRIDPARLVITPVRALFRDVSNCEERIISVAIAMTGAGYRTARRDIETFLEQTGQRIYYGLDEVAYRGRRARGTTMAGFLDLLIPLLVTGLTVLNTMRGSVYERRDEIFVYNAVGIAPRYVFFMFVAEAFVYAVVGSVLGYLLSQGTGRILTALNMTGGLTMTFSSVATIYASLTIAGAVFLSTYFPARSAMEIAAPAEESGWSLPEPDGDLLEFDLPFNFSHHGRVAVLAFFDRYLKDNGEGSAGRFFAGVPRVGIALDEESDSGGEYIPQISTTIWLKPFDLGVCQEMTILMPPDPETGQYKARIVLERQSGTRESWIRLNEGFVTLIRRHFLHWRAVSDSEREEMFGEARELLARVCLGASPGNPA